MGESEKNIKKEGESGRTLSGADLAVHFVLCIVLCSLFGMWLDGQFATDPLLTLIFTFIGFGAGLLKFWQSLNKDE